MLTEKVIDNISKRYLEMKVGKKPLSTKWVGHSRDYRI